MDTEPAAVVEEKPSGDETTTTVAEEETAETAKTTDASLDITEQDEVLDYDEEMPHE